MQIQRIHAHTVETMMLRQKSLQTTRKRGEGMQKLCSHASKCSGAATARRAAAERKEPPPAPAAARHSHTTGCTYAHSHPTHWLLERESFFVCLSHRPKHENANAMAMNVIDPVTMGVGNGAAADAAADIVLRVRHQKKRAEDISEDARERSRRSVTRRAPLAYTGWQSSVTIPS